MHNFCSKLDNNICCYLKHIAASTLANVIRLLSYKLEMTYRSLSVSSCEKRLRFRNMSKQLELQCRT